MKTDLKTKREYDVRVMMGGKIRKRTTTGYRVVLPGLENYKLFLNREFLMWNISEETTGMRFPDICEAATRQEAIDKAIALLRERHIDDTKFSKIVAKAIKETGKC